MAVIVRLIPGTDDAVRIKVGDEFIEWTADEFIGHLRWIEADVKFAQKFGVLRNKVLSIETVTSKASYEDFCPACNSTEGHEEGCWIVAIKGDKQC